MKSQGLPELSATIRVQQASVLKLWPLARVLRLVQNEVVLLLVSCGQGFDPAILPPLPWCALCAQCGVLFLGKTPWTGLFFRIPLLFLVFLIHLWFFVTVVLICFFSLTWIIVLSMSYQQYPRRNRFTWPGFCILKRALSYLGFYYLCVSSTFPTYSVIWRALNPVACCYTTISMGTLAKSLDSNLKVIFKMTFHFYQNKKISLRIRKKKSGLYN